MELENGVGEWRRRMGLEKVVCRMGFEKVVCRMGLEKVVCTLAQTLF